MAWSDGEVARPWQKAPEPDGFHTGIVSTTYICLRIIPNKDTLYSGHPQSLCGKSENPLVRLPQLLFFRNQGFIHTSKQTRLKKLGLL